MIRTASIGLTGLVLATCLGLSSPLPAFAQAQLTPGQAPPQFRPVDADRIVAAMQVDRLADVLAAEIAVSAKGRGSLGLYQNSYIDFLQTDATISSAYKACTATSQLKGQRHRR